MRLLREGILRRCTPTYTHTHTHKCEGRGARHGVGGGGAVYRGKSDGKRGRGREARKGPAPRVDSRYTAATSVSAMSARSDFYNAPCTLPHSRSLTPSHPPPRRGAEDLRERGERQRAFHEATSERANGPRESARARGFLSVRWNLFEDFSEKLVNCVVAIAEEVRSNGEIGSIVRIIKAINLAFYRIYILHRAACDY